MSGLVCAALLVTADFSSAQTRYFVNVAGGGGGSCGGGLPIGRCWADPYLTLQDALLNPLLLPGSEIWVARGTYYPVNPLPTGQPSGAQQATSFVVPEGVLVYGGFVGTETLLSQRSGPFDQTILSGDIDQSLSTTPADTDTIVTIATPGFGTRVDGFTIRNAWADGPSGLLSHGGGVAVDGMGSFVSPAPLLANLSIEWCNALEGGGGIYATSSFDAKYCVVHSCIATGGAQGTIQGLGGGILLEGDLFAQLYSLTLYNNRAWRGGGLAVAFEYETGRLESQNLIIRDNLGAEGGGVHLRAAPGLNTLMGRTQFNNATIAYNQTAGPMASIGGAGMWYDAPLLSSQGSLIYNSIIWGNVHTAGGVPAISSIRLAGTVLPDIRSSDVELPGTGTVPGLNNINQVPLFQDIPNRLLRLLPASPCVDAGDDSLLLGDPLDLDENPTTVIVPRDNGRTQPREIPIVTGVPTGVEGGAVVPGICGMGALETGDNEQGEL